ncbi:anti-anti-sigma factor [Nocardioides terrae]|uniref:Anti-sigma factor antagonist n=1 Tax=Nocardioides terrae TaxID=574651 RepID=A0A1I1L6Q4_9ACTN|nr:STAS domain-containing protein [Nocardioides terrae]SFC68635.1 anti-anti-sigma factor [Nocardioides terrae]
MELDIARVGSELSPRGSVDLVSRQQLVDAGREVLAEHQSLTLNMKAVDFMDSVGLGALIELAKLASAAGGSLAVIEPSRSVHRLLTVTGLADAWPPAESPAEPPSDGGR